jgi:putative aminopeptidase FrvX
MRSTEEFKKLIFSLCDSNGVSGDEEEAAAVVSRELSRFMPVKTDTLGNVTGERGGCKTHILLDAHLDRIGMIVTSVGDDGFIMAAPCGGVDRRVLPAAGVIILGKEKVFGVVTSTPPHLSKGGKEVPDFDAFSVDTGLCGDKAKELISPGDRILLKTNQRRLIGSRISSAALDNRAGVAAVLRCLEMLEDKKSDCKLTVLFSVQEETTGGGAKTGSFSSDAAESITVDVSFAASPGIPAEKSAPLGNGVMIGFAPSLCREMSKELVMLAEENSIPYSRDVMGGGTGTNAESVAFSKGGKRAALLSIPIRNMHTPVEVCDVEDIENTARLMCAYIMKKGGVVND